MSLLSSIAFTSKEAGLEQPDQKQLESDFSQLAFQFIQDRAASLTPYMLGFEVVERDDDGGKVCGVFGYKIGKSYYMVPVFFINGQIKGINSIYSKDTNTFSPLSEGVINKLMSRDTIELGKSVNRVDAYRSFENPSLTHIKDPYNKIASVSNVSDILRDMWAGVKAAGVEIFDDKTASREFANLYLSVKGEGFPAYDAETSPLKEIIKKAGPTLNGKFLEKCAKDSGFASAVADMYGSPSSVSVPMGMYADNALEFQTKLTKKAEKITVVTQAKGMSEEDAKRIVRTGFTIKDTRSADEVSKLYDVQFLKRLTAPSRPGRYSFLMRSGDFTEAWVLRPFGIEPSEGWLVMEPTKHFCYKANPSDIFVDEGNPKDNDFYEKAKSIDSMEVGKSYIIVNEAGNYLGPVVIEAVISEPGKRKRLRVGWDYISHGRVNHRTLTDERCTVSERYTSSNRIPSAHNRDYILLNPDVAGEPTLVLEDGINLPSKGMKAIEHIEVADELRDEADAFHPGSPITMKEVLYKSGACNIAAIRDTIPGYYKIVRDGQFSSEGVTYKTACKALVFGFGLKLSDAEGILKEADEENKAEYLVHVKYAQSMPEQDVMMPQVVFPENTGSDPYSQAYIQTPMQASVTGSQPNYLPPNDPTLKGIQDRDFNRPLNASGVGGQSGNSPEEPDVFQLAQQASQSGQKSVFDHAGIAGLSKLYDINSLVDSYVPEMSKSLDRIGRMLFLFHWKNEDFAERFGADAMPEMEDALTSIYKSFGDLVLKLRERGVESVDTSTFN